MRTVAKRLNGMNPIRSFKKAVLHTEIVLGLAYARLLIKLVPLRWWKSTLGPIDGRSDAGKHPLTPQQLKHASDIGRIIRRIAGKQKFEAVCLPQAMTGRWVLARRGTPSEIVLGSRRNADGLALHAWLKVGETVVTGAEEYETYRSFVAGKARN